MAISARVVINCVGPFRYFGAVVVDACKAAGTHYVDINGETEFVERMSVAYPPAPQSSSNPTLVSCCGFDCMPSDLGLLFVKQQFAKRGWVAATSEMFLSLVSGPKGAVINYATYESAVQSIAHVEDLRKFRKQVKRKREEPNGTDG